MNMNKKLMIILLIFTLYSEFAIAVTYTYDERGNCVNDGTYTYSYTYYDDGTVKTKTRLNSSGAKVHRWDYTYDSDTKSIKVIDYAVSGNQSTKRYDNTWVYENIDTFNNAALNASKLSTSHALFDGSAAYGPYGASYRTQTAYNGANPFTEGTMFYINNSQNQMTDMYLCKTSSCITQAQNGNYSGANRDWHWTYTQNPNGTFSITQVYWGMNQGTATYTIDQYGNVIQMTKNGQKVFTNVWNDPNWLEKISKKAVSDVKRIYTVEEATEALGKNNKNTFSIRYR